MEDDLTNQTADDGDLTPEEMGLDEDGEWLTVGDNTDDGAAWTPIDR